MDKEKTVKWQTKLQCVNNYMTNKINTIVKKNKIIRLDFQKLHCLQETILNIRIQNG